MRRASMILSFLLASAWCLAQNSPPLAGQAPPSAEGQGPRHRGMGPGVAGTITAINSGSFTVKTMDGRTVQVNLSSNTQFRKNRQPAALSDFKVGDEIFVRGSAAGDNAWQAEVVAARPAGAPGEGMREAMGKRFIVGEVKAVNGTQLTIQRPDGVSQTVAVDESTSFQKQGESITLADIKPGDHVFGRGELKNNVFVPVVLNVGEVPMGHGPGRGQWQGQGQGMGAGKPPAQTPPPPVNQQ